METEVAQAKVDKIKVKMALSETHNKCEAQNFQNQSQHEALELQLSTIQGPTATQTNQTMPVSYPNSLGSSQIQDAMHI